MNKPLRIGTRDSQLAVWQATQVKELLAARGTKAELVYIKSDGDTNLVAPLYEVGVQGIFTKRLDTALLNNEIDLAVHSLKDVPTQLPQGVTQAAVLARGPVADLLVYKNDPYFMEDPNGIAHIATSSVRRRSQWLNRFPNHHLHNLRGNVNTRLRKLQEEPWHGAIFAAAGLERIHLRPAQSIELHWMLPAPAQGAITIACREKDAAVLEACTPLNDPITALCTRIERDFLRTLLGGCTTPISAYAQLQEGSIHFKGQLLSPDGKQKIEIEKISAMTAAASLGILAAQEVLQQGGEAIIESVRHARL